MSMPYGDPDDLAFFGRESQPSTAELADPRAGIGRLVPLGVKLQAAYQGMPLADAMVAVSNAVVGLGVIPADALSATVQVQANPVRFTFAGTPPTPAVGMRADASSILVVTGRESLEGFQAIREGAADAVLAVTFWS